MRRGVLYAVNTEKAVRLAESDNKLIVIIGDKSTKSDVKKDFEKRFKIKVKKVNVLNDFKGRKKAYVTLPKEVNALDVLNELGGA